MHLLDMCGYTQTFDHLGVYCRGLLSDLPRKTVEPIALDAGIAVRTLQEFLKDHVWDFAQPSATLQRHVAARLPDPARRRPRHRRPHRRDRHPSRRAPRPPACSASTAAASARSRTASSPSTSASPRAATRPWSMPTCSCPSPGTRTATAAARPASPTTSRYRPKWQIALEQLDRAGANGVAFDWLTFDEGYGDKPGFLQGLDERQLRFVGEVPQSFCLPGGHAAARTGRTPGEGAAAEDLVRHSPACSRSSRGRLPAGPADGGRAESGR